MKQLTNCFIIVLVLRNLWFCVDRCMNFWTSEKIGGQVNLTWSLVRRTSRNFSLFLSLNAIMFEKIRRAINPLRKMSIKFSELFVCACTKCISVNPETKFRGTKWRPAEQSETGFGRGVRGSSPGNFQKPVLQMVQSEVFLSYICEYN